jgi:hypothetical protein
VQPYHPWSRILGGHGHSASVNASEAHLDVVGQLLGREPEPPVIVEQLMLIV